MFNQIATPPTLSFPLPGSFNEPRPSSNFFPRRAHLAKPLFKLIGALRGFGDLDVSGVAIPVAYQIDAFSAGATRMATGGLEGDFGSWPGVADATEGASGFLRLESGVRLPVTIVGAGEGQLEIDLPCNSILTSQMSGEDRR
jgi:hypothetical protein